MWLFDGNEYVSPIHTEDEMMIGISYQHLMDVCKANATYLKGKKKNPGYTYRDALKDDLKEYIEMIVENTWEEFSLCADKMVEEMERRYADV